MINVIEKKREGSQREGSPKNQRKSSFGDEEQREVTEKEK